MMDPELERALRALDDAAKFAKSYRFEMTEDYLALLGQVLQERGSRALALGSVGPAPSGAQPAKRQVRRDRRERRESLGALDAENLIQACTACDDAGLELWLADEPLDRPRDRWLAEQIVARRALTRATGPNELQVDFTLVMKGFEFEAGRQKDQLFQG